MRIRVLNSKQEIENVHDEKVIHLSFRPSDVDMLEIIKRCPELKAVQIPTSYISSISVNMPRIMEMQGIALLEGDIKSTSTTRYMEVSDD